MKRFIAIDNVCAWPNLTLMPDGVIVAMLYNQPCHMLWEGDVECWSSRDGGATWSRLGVVAQHEPGTNQGHVAAGLTRGGDLIAITSGHTNRPAPGAVDVPPFEGSPISQPWSNRSTDGGRTWRTVKHQFPRRDGGLSVPIPFGDICVAADGSLVAGAYEVQEDIGWKSASFRRGNVLTVRSDDDGETWRLGSAIVEDRHVEAAMLHLGGGKWLANIRVMNAMELDVFVSDDDARTWRHITRLGIPGTSASHLARLQDGRIMLVYGNRCTGNRGIDARFSGDGGVTWSRPRRLIHLPDGDCGYPTAIQKPDGSILVAYYAQKCESHHRYHMGVLLFNASELA